MIVKRIGEAKPALGGLWVAEEILGIRELWGDYNSQYPMAIEITVATKKVRISVDDFNKKFSSRLTESLGLMYLESTIYKNVWAVSNRQELEEASTMELIQGIHESMRGVSSGYYKQGELLTDMLSMGLNTLTILTNELSKREAL